MRRAQNHHRHDANHKPISDELKARGYSVKDTSQLGNDFPDLIVGRWGRDVKVELKSDGELSEGQIKFAREWQGEKPIMARTIEEIVDYFNRLLVSEG